MLERIDFAKPGLSKEAYKPRYEELVERLVVLQQQARLAEAGVVVVFEGWNGAGKGSRISDLVYHLDARAMSVAVTEDFDTDEAQHFLKLKQGVSGYYPAMQEFWKALGSRGSTSFFDRGWYTKAVQSLLFALYGPNLECERDILKKKDAERMMDILGQHLQSIGEFERQLTSEGYCVVKFFLHISAEVQKKRLTQLHEDPATRWRVSKKKLRCTEIYQQSLALYEDLLARSNFDFAPWIILNGEDKRQANLEIAEALVNAFEASAISASPSITPAPPSVTPASPSIGTAPSSAIPAKAGIHLSTPTAELPAFAPSDPLPSLSTVSHNLSLRRSEYKKKLSHEQKRFYELELELYLKRVPLMLLFEGWDAAGKGGAIKRAAQALDARAYTIFPSPAPSADEKLHPYLWRYWTRLPKAGHVGIYDRSWYGRVLVERIEGFATLDEWSRAYDEINAFEHDLTSWGALLLKFWVEVSQEEQLKRFEERAADPNKRWKITEDDWRNRAKYPEYRAAVEDMLSKTSTAQAPWIILEGEDKYYARVKTLQAINNALEKRLH